MGVYNAPTYTTGIKVAIKRKKKRKKRINKIDRLFLETFR